MRCPNCQATGTIVIDFELRARPIGSFSLAGAQMKVSAEQVAIAECTACGARTPGRLENTVLGPDGKTFTGGHFVADPAPES